MTADDLTTPTPLDPLPRVRRRLRSVARRGLWVVARPYARRRSRRADVLARLGRLETEVKQVGERHSEQIERLEDLARELVLTAESLRREIVRLAAAAEQPLGEAPQEDRVKS
jgi:hypothetical protein